jgi:phage/plasmid-associated DNA primase
VRADPGKEEFLQRAAFASLTGDTSDKAFMNPYDENVGNTGKTTFIESLLATFGSVRCHGER